MDNSLFKELKKDHKTVKDIFKKMEETDDKACQERQNLFNMLKMELIPHMKAEEEALYAPLEEKDDVKDDTMEALEEHHVAEMVFKELEKMPCDHEGWKAKAVVLGELVEHHVEEEETTIFEDTEEVFSADQIKEIHLKFKENKQKHLTALENKHQQQQKPRSAKKQQDSGKELNMR